MSPKYSIDLCPICGGGLCGIRICGVQTRDKGAPIAQEYETAHGLIVCDECEAIWLEPDVTTDHQYPDSEDAACPICATHLWGEGSRWADSADITALGWAEAVNHEYDTDPESNQGMT